MKKLHPEEFPPLLNEIPDAPKQLYLEGTLPDPDTNYYLAVVGTRKPSSYGLEVCDTLIAGLQGLPIVIISGLAVGIDTRAHKAALRAGLKTIAVPGSGLDRSVIHPPSNKRFADEIIESGGALLSELEPLAPAGLHTFPKRNRIMAGLARAVLVIEAGEQSGTLITARLALDYNREVLAVPGSMFAPLSRGTNTLIREGATPIASEAELMQALGYHSAAHEAPSRDSLSPLELQIIELLSVEPLPRDEIIRALARPASEVNTLLATLELAGHIVERMGELHLR